MRPDAPSKRFYEKRALEMPAPEPLPPSGKWVYPETMSLRVGLTLPPNPWFLEDARQECPELAPVEPVHVSNDDAVLAWAAFAIHAGLR